MGLYESTPSNDPDKSPFISQKEVPLYGSSRIGLHKFTNRIFGGSTTESTTNTSAPIIGSTRGHKYYEQSNHLGNILATVTDLKVGLDLDTDGIADSYEAEVASAADYYPFGWEMPGRKYNSSEYRYGFNGKEKDQDGEFGSITNYDYGFRIYNPAVGRFLSVDPLSPEYPFYTPYQFAGNKPIVAIDLDGLEEEFKFNAYAAMEEASKPGLSHSDTRKVYRESLESLKILYPIDPDDVAAAVATGVVLGFTGGLGAPYLEAFMFRTALWGSNPANQILMAEAGALTAAAIDPNPAAQYSTGLAGDEVGNVIGQGIRYLFRGTSSITFEGSSQMIRAGVTPTSHNPLVSTLYAMYTKAKFGEGTLLIGKADDLANVEVRTGISQLKHDREVGLDMLPTEFAKLAQEVKLENAVTVLKDMGFEVPSVNTLNKLDAALKEVPDFTQDQITKFIEGIQKLTNQKSSN